MVNQSASEMHRAWISLGSNMGDKIGHCRIGMKGLEASGHSVITGVSRYYRTAPVDYTDQEWFVNAAVEIETRLDPFELLKEIHAIEKGAGRDRAGVRFGPRTLDMDILIFDQVNLKTSELTLPHPRMHKRRFVLQPLCDIDPTILHPVFEKTVQELLDAVDDPDQELVLYQ
ncbi:MAG: 2-amino-4-hydroxy-6-hydroxymethyldihydropteridine diphosphokinase [Thermodesulfobacteriota bacterium]